MSMRRHVRAKFGRRSPYGCTLCGLTFETERHNCPACGSIVSDNY